MTKHGIILGGSGQIGRAVASRLLDAGWSVTLASRGQRDVASDLVARGARSVAFDRSEPGALAAAIGSGADAVVDTVAFDRQHADQLLEVQASVGSYVVISSCSVYKDGRGRTLEDGASQGSPQFDGPVSETMPTVEPGETTYSTRKVALERRLLDQASKPVVIIRPGAIYGCHTQHPREWWFIKRMLDGRKFIPLAYRGDSGFHTIAVENIAAIIDAALANPETGILNAGDPEPPSILEIGSAIARYLGYRGEIVPQDIGDQYGKTPIGSTPWSLPHPFILSTSAASAIGYKPAVTYGEAIGPYCDWLAQHDPSNWQNAFPVLAGYPSPPFDYEAEDRYAREREA